MTSLSSTHLEVNSFSTSTVRKTIQLKVEMESFHTKQKLSSDEEGRSSDESAGCAYSIISSSPLTTSPEESPRDFHDDFKTTGPDAKVRSDSFPMVPSGSSPSPPNVQQENSIPNFPAKLNQTQLLQLQELQNKLFCDEAGKPKNPMEVIDARGALALYYNYPKTLEHHMGARLLLKWKWHYFAKFNFWYAIFEHPESKKISACYYDIQKEKIESDDLAAFYQDLNKLAAQNMF